MSQPFSSAAQDTPRVYDVADICRALDLSSEQSGYRVMCERQIAGVVYVGRRCRVIRDVFDAWLAAGCPPVEDFERSWRQAAARGDLHS